jgi:hypothetical protein
MVGDVAGIFFEKFRRFEGNALGATCHLEQADIGGCQLGS